MISSRDERAEVATESAGTIPASPVADLEFEALGSKIRIIVQQPLDPRMETAEEATERVREFIELFDRTLSRFRPDSELSAFNSDPRETVPASNLLRQVVSAGVEAARKTCGLVDPTLQADLERAGYVQSRAGAKGLPADQLLEDSVIPRAAAPSRSRLYESFEVDHQAETISRPSGVSFDPGGIGKGLAADLACEMLGAHSRYLVSCGGDIRVGGEFTAGQPFDVFVEHPISGHKPHFFRLGSGGIATSGIAARSWRNPDGSVAHHLLDPATGEPCRTGLLGTTALAPSALEAEVLAKHALLAGPTEGLALLGENGGGLIVHEDGRTEIAGRARVRFHLPAGHNPGNGARS